MPAPSGRALLEIALHDQPPTRLVLTSDTVRIGRSRDNEILVPDGHISKQHAEVRVDADRYVVADTGSRAGLLVNGAKVESHALDDGDVIELGASSPVRITFRANVAPEATSFSSVVADLGQGSMARLARFFEFSQKLGGGFALEEVLQDVVDLAIDVTKAERGMLILRREDDSLETKVARLAGGRSLPLDGLRVSETLVRKAFAAGRPSLVMDVNQDADLALQASIVSLELRSAVTLPLLRHEGSNANDTGTMTVFGLVYLDSRSQRGGFDGFDLGILERLARDASAVIENARLVREEAEQRRIAQEVAMAREVQATLMPEQWRSTEAFEIAGTCVPCHELGGDYVDQFDLGGGRVALVVADVAGKGIAASLLAATLQGALAAEMAQRSELGEVVSRVNRVHCRLAPVGRFITLAVVLLEPDGTLALVNAGHCPALHVSRDGVRALTTAGIALGLDADFEYRAVSVPLQPGDTLVLFTDGVVECEGADRALFGDERLARAVAASRGAPPAQVLAQLVREVDRFRGNTPVSDDLSVLVVRRA
jgi:sigma-B regulation protein RsbU (phosphoserine phosphatase)